MPRQSRGVPLIKRKVSLPKPVWDMLDQHLNDPTTGQLKYGALTRYFERVVKADLRKQERFMEAINALEKEAEPS